MTKYPSLHPSLPGTAEGPESAVIARGNFQFTRHVIGQTKIGLPQTEVNPSRLSLWDGASRRTLVSICGHSNELSAKLQMGQQIGAEHLSRTLGQSVVVENKAGANGNIGIDYVTKSALDGYKILIGTDAVSSNPRVYKMSFDPLIRKFR